MSTTTTETTKTLKTTAAAEPIKTIKTIVRTAAKGQVTQAEAAKLAPGTATMTTRTVTENKTTKTQATTATFREGKDGVSFFLMDISHAESDKVRMEDSLIEHLKDTICILEKKSGETIKQIYIGKSYCAVDQRYKDKQFRRLNHEHWTLSGINSRWTNHQEKTKVPSDGMVVLCAFTRDDLPIDSRRSHEFLALAMEQRLIQHFQIFDTKTSTINKDFKPGKTTNHTKNTSHDTSSVLSDNSKLDLTADNPIAPDPKYCAYVVYMTYSYLPPEKKSPSSKQKPVEDDSDTDSGEDDTDSGEEEATSKDDDTPLPLESTPIPSQKSASSSKENNLPLPSPLSTMKKDLQPVLLNFSKTH